MTKVGTFKPFEKHLLKEGSTSIHLNKQGIVIVEVEDGYYYTIFNTWDAKYLDHWWRRDEKRMKDKKFKILGSNLFLKEFQLFCKQRKIIIEKSVERQKEFDVKLDFGAKRIQVSNEEFFVKKPLIKEEKNKELERVYAKKVVEVKKVVEKEGQSKIKILIVDDSPTIGNLLKKIFKEDSSLEVVAVAHHPSLAEDLILLHRPHVMTLDIHMPQMDGVTLLKQLLPKYQIPTVMISSISKEEGPQVLEALEAGAIDYVQKPSLTELPVVGPRLIDAVKTAARAKIRRKVSRPTKTFTDGFQKVDHLILFGSSTGGTEALLVVLEGLPAQIPPILCVQHIPAVFSKAFADRLNTLLPFEVAEAKDGDEVRPNRVLISPGGQQMGIVKRNGKLFVQVSNDPPVNRHKPSVDYLFQSAAALKLDNVIGAILTGMGADGAKELKTLRDQGAKTIAQNEETCVVFGMPREAIKLDAAEYILPIEKIASQLVEIVNTPVRRMKTG